MNEYSSFDIVSKEGLSGLRFKPTMYCGVMNARRGQAQILKEIVDNSVDEFGQTPEVMHYCDIFIIEDKRGGSYQVIVNDSGRGIPLTDNAFKRCITVPHTSGKYKGSGAYDASGGTFGIGLKLSAALCRQHITISRRSKGTGYLRLRGEDIDDNIIAAEKYDKTPHLNTGVLVFYEIEKGIFPDLDRFVSEGVEEILELLKFINVFIKNVQFKVYLGKGRIAETQISKLKDDINSTIAFFKDICVPEGPYKFKNLYINDTTITPAAYFKQQCNIVNTSWELEFEKTLDRKNPNDTIGYNIRLCVNRNLKNPPVILQAVNMVRTSDMTSYHITGLAMVLKEYLVKVMDLDNGRKEYFLNLYKLPMCMAIMIKCKNVEFIGQTKDAFKDKEKFLIPYMQLLRRHLYKLKPDWEVLANAILNDFEQKYRKYANKGLIVSDTANLQFSLNKVGKFTDCSTKDRTKAELFICEGDSAGGPITEGRDPEFQALFCQSGKPINPLKRTDDKRFYQNAMIQDLIKIIGLTPEDTDMSKSNFGKLIILTDADAHGQHIAAIDLGAILYKINPHMYSHGMVYVANPPLYKMATGVNKRLFFKDDTALMEMVVSKVYINALDIYMCAFNSSEKRKIESDLAFFICNMVKTVGRIVETAANTLMIEPLIFERLIPLVDYIDEIESNYINRKPYSKQLNIVKERIGADNIQYDGINRTFITTIEQIDRVIPLNNLTREIRAFVIPEYDRFKLFDIYFQVSTRYTEQYTDAPMTLMCLYYVFESLDKIAEVTRFKGLGEMNADELEATCLDPNTRILKRVTGIGDLTRICELLGSDSAPRKTIMDKIRL